MKDMYSFHTTQEDFEKFYTTAKQSYLNIFSRVGLDAKVTEASGGSFTEKLSYEYMVVSDAGEDDIVYCDKCTHCANVEVSKEKVGDTCPKCKEGKLAGAKAAEVGNIFDLGQKYVKDFNFTYKDSDGKEQHPIMGCYGIGVTRLMGTIVETLSDEKGIVWPESVAPFRVHLISLGNDEAVIRESLDLYNSLSGNGIEVLYDDRDVTAGEKFKDSDLIGIPYRIVVSEKSLLAGGVELKRRSGDGKEEILGVPQILDMFRR